MSYPDFLNKLVIFKVRVLHYYKPDKNSPNRYKDFIIKELIFSSLHWPCLEVPNHAYFWSGSGVKSVLHD